jgi:murein DD-endopeptidase MepM/ murein hydrolase activator NlpD
MKRIAVRHQFQKLKKKFQLTIFNESTLENFFSLRVSLLDGIFMAASLALIVFFLSWFLMAHTPLRAFLPQDLDPRLRQQMIQEAARVDSLSDVLDRQAKYLKVINGIISGNIPMDSLRKKEGKITIDSLAINNLELMPATKRELKFREEYEDNEKYNLSILSQQSTEKNMLLYPPLKGKVAGKFNPKLKAFGIRIETSSLQPSVAVLDGTVLFAAYTSDYDYVVEIQHNNDYISVYKYNTELLKKQGDKVKAGEAIGMVGENPARTGLPVLQFELWHKGIPLNPEEYIVF